MHVQRVERTAQCLFGYAGRVIAGDVVEAHQRERVQVGLDLPAGAEQVVAVQQTSQVAAQLHLGQPRGDQHRDRWP